MAILTDYHCHTNISLDGKSSMADMALAEYAAGVRRLCFTDHCDPVDWHTLEFYPRCRQVASLEHEALESCRDRLPPDLEVRLGIELGESHFYPEVAKELAASPWLDFVLGSYHITKEYGDYYWIHYESVEQCDKLFDRYLDNLQVIAEANFFDAMAHIGYFRRYAWQQGVDAALTLDKFGEKVERLLRTIIANGKGIECNCSGIRDGCGPFPSLEILRRYKSLGGEIVTVGSDAHRTVDAAKCLREGYDVLRTAGFAYVATFKKHKPEFIKL